MLHVDHGEAMLILDKHLLGVEGLNADAFAFGYQDGWTGRRLQCLLIIAEIKPREPADWRCVREDCIHSQSILAETCIPAFQRALVCAFSDRTEIGVLTRLFRLGQLSHVLDITKIVTTAQFAVKSVATKRPLGR